LPVSSSLANFTASNPLYIAQNSARLGAGHEFLLAVDVKSPYVRPPVTGGVDNAGTSTFLGGGVSYRKFHVLLPPKTAVSRLIKFLDLIAVISKV
jgi:hypothetical protein